MSTRQRTRAVVAGAGLIALVAACTPEIPEVDPDPEPTETMPVLDEPRLERVLDDIGAVIAEADGQDDTDVLATRMQDPALTVRGAEYTLRDATADEEDSYAIQPLTTEDQVAIVAASEEWPRTAMVVTEIPDEANVPLLIGLRQQDPQSAYRMFSWVRLLPGVTMPDTDIPESGSPEVPADSEDFLISPEQAVSQYADLLTEGSDSDYADAFAEDIFREGFEQEVDALAENIDDAGDFDHSTSAEPEDTVAMATADGGVIVLGSMTTTQEFTKTEAEGEVNLGGYIAALSEEDGEVNETLTATYDLMVGFYVPASADDAQTTVLGVERVLSGVEES